MTDSATNHSRKPVKQRIVLWSFLIMFFSFIAAVILEVIISSGYGGILYGGPEVWLKWFKLTRAFSAVFLFGTIALIVSVIIRLIERANRNAQPPTEKTSHIWVIVLMGLGMWALPLGSFFFLSNPTQDTPEIISRPLPHINPEKAYDYDLEAAFNNLKNSFPEIETVRKIPEDYVRPRRTRQHIIETSEAGAQVTLYAEFPEQPLDMCITPCSLNANVSERYKIIIYKYGFSPQQWGVDTGIWPAEDIMTIPLGLNWVQVYEEQKRCFDQNELRLSEDQDAKPCIRIPPDMPRQAEKSGHCRVMFNITNTGYPTDVQALNCTDPVFKASAVKSVRLWYYYPKVENNVLVKRRNLRSTIRFRLTDEDGELIPE